MRYKIYAGLGGGFGGATSQGVFEYDSLREAEEDAYNLAVEAYESYGGLHGLTNWDECKQELYDNGDITAYVTSFCKPSVSITCFARARHFLNSSTIWSGRTMR